MVRVGGFRWVFEVIVVVFSVFFRVSGFGVFFGSRF